MIREEDFKEFPSGRLVHTDGWEYRYSSDGECVKVEYWEERGGVLTHNQHADFSVPLYVATTLFYRLISLVERSDMV